MTIGDKFGKWIVVGKPFYKSDGKQNHLFVACRCHCGTVRDIKCYNLRSGRSTSCGCTYHPRAKRFDDNTKECARCHQRKHHSEFYSKNKRSIGGLNSWCKECSYWDTIKRKYNLTQEEYTRLQGHNNQCMCCGKKEAGSFTTTKRLHIDHDHKTGKVRGLLCSNCNRGLGCFLDTPELLRKAAVYLEKPA